MICNACGETVFRCVRCQDCGLLVCPTCARPVWIKRKLRIRTVLVRCRCGHDSWPTFSTEALINLENKGHIITNRWFARSA